MCDTPKQTNSKQQRLQQWHHLFGLLLTDYFTGSPYEVELEKDLSQQQQWLDVVVMRPDEHPAPSWPTEPLPDGFEALRPHNLISFKSHNEPFNRWAAKELISHAVIYRKLVSPPAKLMAEEKIGLYAVSNHYPMSLKPWLTSTEQPGIYDIAWGSDTIRLIVTRQVRDVAANRVWQIFSHDQQKVIAALNSYQPHRPDVGMMVINQLRKSYQQEGFEMAYTVEQFMREVALENLDKLSAEEVLKHYSAEERLRDLSPEERLRDLSPEERLRDLSPEELLRNLSPEERLRDLSPEERLRDLSPEEQRAMLEQLKQQLGDSSH